MIGNLVFLITFNIIIKSIFEILLMDW